MSEENLDRRLVAATVEEYERINRLIDDQLNQVRAQLRAAMLSPPASWAPSYAWGTAGRSAAWSRATSGPLRRRKGARRQ